MFSEPAIGERFFGREEVLELLNKRVAALKDGYRQNVALTGRSLSGKSSVIHHFLYSIKEEGFTPIYVEVVKEPFASFSNKFIATMLYNSLAGMGERAEVEFDKLLDRAQKALPKTFSAIKRIKVSTERDDVDEAYSDLLGLTSVLKEETGRPCIVILDEFDNLEHLGVRNPFLSFGKVIMVQKDTMYIVSSSRDQAIKKILSEKLSLLFGNFEIVKVSSFDLSSSSDFLRARLAGFEMNEKIKKFMIAFTDGNPFYLDKVSGLSKEIALARMTSYIDEDIVTEAILELIYNSSGVIHQYLLNFMLELLDSKNKDTLISMMLSIAGGQNKQSEIARGMKLKRGEVAKGLTRLLELGLISKKGVCHNVDDSMLGFWLKYVYQRRRDLLIESSNLDKLSIFREDIRTYISRFVEESAKDTTTRIAELLNLFSNELVQLEDKHMRLPHFTKVEIRPGQDTGPFIVASFRGNSWMVQAYEREVSENDILSYIKSAKNLGCKISNKVIITLRGMDENAKLLAKELRIAIWDTSTVNILFGIYGKNRLVAL